MDDSTSSKLNEMPSFCKFLLFTIITYSVAVCYAQKVATPVVLKADVVKYDANFEGISANGNVYVTMGPYILTSDTLYFDIKRDVLFAEGNIRIKDEEGRIILGQKAILKDKLKKGIIDEFTLKLPDGSILVAASAKRRDTKRAHLHKASFTPCKITCARAPIWQVKAQETDIDYDEERIKYKNMFFEVYGIPIVFLPYFSHPTPTAPAQSGILIPHIKDNNLVIPLYFRATSNLDFTLSPRLAANYTIIEGQFRHLVREGSYEINGSSGNPSFKKGSKDSQEDRYHIFANGNFNRNDFNYGFDINRTSDKAYLTNYFEIYDSYLESKLYANKIDEGEYASIETYSYQGLRAQDKKSTTPWIFPRIRNQKIINLNNEETIFFKIKNDAIAYNENYDKQLARNALELMLSTNILTPQGHLFNLAFSNRNDLYLYSFTDPLSKLNKEKTWNRNIPELQAKWRYPLIRHFSNIAVKLEPVIAAFVGINYNKRFDKFALVDVAKYELSEYNLFSSNRFSGIDYHDYGKRLSYGLNTSLFSDPYYFDIFLGQLVYQNNIVTKGNSEYVGNTSFDIASNLKLYYRFRKNEKFKSIRDEVGMSATADKLTANLGFSRLNNISKYYADDKFNFPANKISQIDFNINYQIFESLKIGAGARIDTTKKTQLLHRSILVTYVMDCVSITGKFYDDYTHDKLRGIRKNSTKTFAVGLKVLNM